MKLVLMLVIRDEEDIIKANLDYHLAAGVDFVMIADHHAWIERWTSFVTMSDRGMPRFSLNPSPVIIRAGG
jgi:hypothetical protein